MNTILLVDDDADDRLLFAEACKLSKCSVNLLQACDGKDALKNLTDPSISKPDLIFLDINMPIMNGWDLLKSIKNRPDLANIPISMYSTSSNNRDIQMAFELGASCFCVKPDDFQLLVTMLQIFCGNLKEPLSEVFRKISEIPELKFFGQYQMSRK